MGGFSPLRNGLNSGKLANCVSTDDTASESVLKLAGILSGIPAVGCEFQMKTLDRED